MDFVVRSGQKRILRRDEDYLVCNSFIMEDNSTVIIGDEVKHWQVTAQIVKIGKNTTIIGTGKDNSKVKGPDGANGRGRERSGTGSSGNSPGKTGPDGGIGKDITFEWNVFKVEDLDINVDGGAAGFGGNGGNGARGRNADCASRGKPGGEGGMGGRGGQGGDAGKVYIEYECVDSTGNEIDTCKDLNIKISSKGGKGGRGGRGGSGAQGGNSHNCGLWTMPGGSRGGNGRSLTRYISPKGSDKTPVVVRKKEDLYTLIPMHPA